jgi:dCMP deaminase
MEQTDHRLFMELAEKAAGKSNCIRRSVGAVIVAQELVVSTGWNGLPESRGDCREAGCPRCINGGDTGSGYETCICIHAEQHAIADAARRGVSTDGCTMYVNLRPCMQCLAIARASGVRRIFFDGEDWKYPEEIEVVYQRLAGQFDAFGRAVEKVR